MDQVPSRRALRTSSVVLLTALLGFLLTVPAGDAADSGGTATYKYKVTDFSYEAVGQTAGGRFKGVCVPEVNALWQGTVSTAADDVADLGAGHGSLKIGQHGTSGTINAHLLTTSTLSDSFHRITTACDKNGNET